MELILAETAEIVRADAGRLICRTHHGFVCANAGVDQSNAGGADHAVLLPLDPDASARALRARLGCAVVDRRLVRPRLARRPGRGRDRLRGAAAGRRLARARPDAGGRELHATLIAVADEAAAAADLVRGKATGEPAVRLRGLERFVLDGGRPRRRGPAPRDASRTSSADPAAGPAALGRDRRAPPRRLVRAHRAPHVEALAGGLDVLAVRQRPRADRAQRRGERGPSGVSA